MVLEMERDRLEADTLYKEKKRRSESTSRALASQRPRAHVPSLPRPHAVQGAAATPIHGGGNHTTNYHCLAQSCPT